MISARDRERLDHILRYAAAAIDALGNLDAQSLDEDFTIYLAVTKAVENVGEAASKLSKPVKAQLAHLSLDEAISMRHVLVHNYFEVKSQIMVDTIRQDLPVLIQGVAAFLEQQDDPA